MTQDDFLDLKKMEKLSGPVTKADIKSARKHLCEARNSIRAADNVLGMRNKTALQNALIQTIHLADTLADGIEEVFDAPQKKARSP